MFTLLCTKCEAIKECSEFSPAKNKKRGYQTHCKACRTAYNKKHYKDNKSTYLTNHKALNESILSEYRRYKEDNPCTDCGKKFPYYIMEFDHTNANKSSSVANLVRAGKHKLWEEIDKCDLLCCICHRHRTHNRRTVV